MGFIEELSEEEETKDEENDMEAAKNEVKDKSEKETMKAVDDCEMDTKGNSSTDSYSGPLFNSKCCSDYFMVLSIHVYNNTI